MGGCPDPYSRPEPLIFRTMSEPIYMDHSATTPVLPEVFEAMQPFFGPRFGNPSSMHRWGREARVALDEARERVARCLGARQDEVCFTSGGTEGDNLAVLGCWHAARTEGRMGLVTTPIEHKAVLAAVHHAAHEGADERILEVTPDGVVSHDSATKLIDDTVALVSVMWVNNEIGVIQPVPELARLAHEHGALFHTDAVQAFGKVDVDAASVPFDMLTISGHKIGAPKGIGAMFIRRGTPLEPLLHGGSQDRGRRPGTENVAFAVGLARAAELAVEHRVAEWTRLEALRDRLQGLILDRVPDAVVHGLGAPRAPHVLSLSVPGVESESLLMALDLAGVACSGGSACQSGSTLPSHVLVALGVRPDLTRGAVRMSLGALTTDECVDRVGEIFPRLVNRARGVAAA